VGRCVASVFTCVQIKPADPACLGKAGRVCDREFAKLVPARAATLVGLRKKCDGALVPYVALDAAEGLAVGALGDVCDDYAVDSVGALDEFDTCLVRQHECRTGELMLFEAPRLQALLGLVGHAPWGAFCPAP
jgi:hypothetical protein